MVIGEIIVRRTFRQSFVSPTYRYPLDVGCEESMRKTEDFMFLNIKFYASNIHRLGIATV